MLLQRLKEYAEERLSLPPTLYSEVPIRYIIELDSEGRMLGNSPTDSSDPASPSTRWGVRRQAPRIQRSNRIKPLLLSDNAEYTLGLAREKSEPSRAAQCHQAYLDILDRCRASTGESSVAAVQAFLTDNPLDQMDLPEGFDRSAWVTLRVNGVFPIDLPSVQDFWAGENNPEASSATLMQCLVCGQERPALERLQAKIKGVTGGQRSGTSIISANAEAFESYGLSASLIAPTCAQCGEKFTQALNALLGSHNSRYVLGGADFLFWTRKKSDFDLMTLLNEPNPDQVRSLLSSIRTGRRDPEPEDDSAFFALVLSGSGARAVVRDWMDTTVGQVMGGLSRWFRLQGIVQPSGESPRYLGLNSLAYSTVREPRDLAPPLPRALLRAALTGTPLNLDLLYQAVRRNRAEQRVTHPRAALIKLVLLSHQPETLEEDFMIHLDANHPSAAYHCGRLLSVLESTQRLAIPGINATIVDRFYGTASSAPASVFPRLTRGAQPHLAKLARDRPGAYHALQRRIEDILGNIPAFPRTLTLEEQGWFTLGYYHQRAHDRGQAREAAERRRQGQYADASDAVLPLDALEIINSSESGEE